MRNLTLFESDRLTLPKALDLTAESLLHYGSMYKHWAIASIEKQIYVLGEKLQRESELGKEGE